MIDNIFGKQNATDDIYIYLRDKPEHAQRRKFIESLWKRFHPYADSEFVNLIASDFQARFWEMYLACTLLDAGFSLHSRDAGPDIRVNTKGAPIWVEAIAPTAGSGPDAIPPQNFDNKCGLAIVNT